MEVLDLQGDLRVLDRGWSWIHYSRGAQKDNGDSPQTPKRMRNRQAEVTNMIESSG